MSIHGHLSEHAHWWMSKQAVSPAKHCTRCLQAAFGAVSRAAFQQRQIIHLVRAVETVEMAQERHSKLCLKLPVKFDHCNYGQNVDMT